MGVGWGGCDNFPLNYNSHVHHNTTVNMYVYLCTYSIRAIIVHFKKYNVYIYIYTYMSMTHYMGWVGVGIISFPGGCFRLCFSTLHIRTPSIESVDARRHVEAISPIPTSDFHSASASFRRNPDHVAMLFFFCVFHSKSSSFFFGTSFSRISTLSVFPSRIVSCTNFIP